MLRAVAFAALLNGAACIAVQGLQQGQRQLRGNVGQGGNFSRTAGQGPKPPQELGNLQWLHIPKTGTSFIATIWTFACSNGKVLDLHVNPDAAPGCHACYDFALMDRYPRDQYCRPGALDRDFQTQHRPWGAHITSTTNVVGFFRRPSQRVISAMKNSFHASGLSSERFSELWASCYPLQDEAARAACFAKFPGIAGCSARMLTGETCATDPAPEQDITAVDRVDNAVANLKRMAFVGITEEWDESICLFHLMFGGTLHRDEFTNEHHGNHPNTDYDEGMLDGFRDEADELVYQAAVARFHDLRAQYAPGGDSACSLINGASDATELRKTDCKQLGAECGEVGEDEDCGACPAYKSLYVQSRSAWTKDQAEGSRPTCTAEHKCEVDGELHPEIFSW